MKNIFHSKRMWLATAALVIYPYWVMAYSIPIEAMIGNRNYYQQFSMSRPLSNGKFGFSSVSSLMLIYNKDRNSELMSQSYVTYTITKNLKFGVGTFYASVPKLKPSFNLQFTGTKDHLFVMVTPRIDISATPSFDLMTMLETKPRLTDLVRGYFRFQSMFNFSGNQHNRSYQYYRLGIDYHQVQLGLAANVDWYGKNYVCYTNYGLFCKLALN